MNDLDYLRLADVILRHDGEVTEGGKDPAAVFAGLIDLPVAVHFSKQRALLLAEQVGRLNDIEFVVSVTAGFLTGLAAGVEFEQRGGTRPDVT